MEGKRIGLLNSMPVMARDNIILVTASGTCIGNKPFPNPAIAMGAQRMAAAIPLVEVSNDTHLRRVRRPQCELCSPHARHRNRVRAQFLIQPQVRSLVKQPNIRIR